MVPQAEERIVKEVSKWSGVKTAPHSFGGTEFKLGRREIGHVHGDYQADIVFPMEIRNQLIEQKRAQPHHILSKSGWITFRFREEKDVRLAIDLFKLSYDIAQERNSMTALQRDFQVRQVRNGQTNYPRLMPSGKNAAGHKREFFSNSS
jgi:hypothetical protein